jgi:hypothetical protein
VIQRTSLVLLILAALFCAIRSPIAMRAVGRCMHVVERLLARRQPSEDDFGREFHLVGWIVATFLIIAGLIFLFSTSG